MVCLAGSDSSNVLLTKMLTKKICNCYKLTVMDEEKIIYGVPFDTLSAFSQIVLDRKNKISIKKMNSDVLTVSKGFYADSHGGNRFRIEFDTSCKLKFEASPTKVILKIFHHSDNEFKDNLLLHWPVKYLCKDFVSRDDFANDRNLSIIKIFVGPGYTSCVDGKTAEVDPSHFASYKSVLMLKCFQNEWEDVNSKIKKMFRLLPLANETLQHLDSGRTSSVSDGSTPR